MAKDGIHIVVGANYSDKDLKRAYADLRRLGGAAKQSQGPMSQLAAGFKKHLTPNLALAGAAAGAFAVKLGVDAVKAAAAEEAAVARLSQALSNAGQAMQLDTLETYIDGMSRATGVADDQMRPAMITLVNATRDATQAQNLMSLALDVSAGSGRDLNSVTLALAKAATGQTTALRRLGVPLSDAAIKSKDLTVISAELSQTFRGQAARAADTFQGQIAQLSVAFGELQEALGKGFIKGLQDGAKGTDDLGDAIEDLEPLVAALGHQVGASVNGLGDLVFLAGEGAKRLGALEGSTEDASNQVEEFAASLINLAFANGGALGAVSDLRDYLEDQGIITESAAEAHKDYKDSLVRTREAAEEAARETARLRGQVVNLGDEVVDVDDYFSNLNDELKIFTGMMDQNEAVRGYQEALDDMRKSIKENGKAFDETTPKGRENADALDDIFDSAVKVAEGQQTAAEKIATMGQASLDANALLRQMGVPPEVRNALLEPFDALITKFTDNNTLADGLKERMEGLDGTKVDVTVTTTYVTSNEDSKPPHQRARGGPIYGMGGPRDDLVPVLASPGEFMVQASAAEHWGPAAMRDINAGRVPAAWRPTMSSQPAPATRGGLTIHGGITVQAAPGERAAESLPRRLRHEMFLAGLGYE